MSSAKIALRWGIIVKPTSSVSYTKRTMATKVLNGSCCCLDIKLTIPFLCTVGSSSKKRKKAQNEVTKMNKKIARQHSTDQSSAVCKSCKQRGHSSSRSPQCKNHTQNKDEIMKAHLGSDYITRTVKLPFKNCVHDNYAHVLRSKILTASDDIRHIVFRAKIFVNYFVLSTSNQQNHTGLFQQNFWYSICQLVNDRQHTNKKILDQNILTHWHVFKEKFPKIVYPKSLQPGASACLTETCKEIATSYLNHIVEGFEPKLCAFVRYHIRQKFGVRVLY